MFLKQISYHGYQFQYIETKNWAKDYFNHKMAEVAKPQEDKKEVVEKTRGVKKDFTTFNGKIPHILHQVHAELSLREETTALINDIIYYVGKKIIYATNVLLERQDKKTLSEKEIETATRLCLKSKKKLCQKAITNGRNAIAVFNKAGTNHKKPTRKETKSGLTIQVSKIERLLIRHFSQASRVGRTSSVYMTAVVETILKEIFTLSGQRALHQKRKQIRINEVRDAVCSDSPELSAFFGDLYMGTVCHPEINLVSEKKK